MSRAIYLAGILVSKLRDIPPGMRANVIAVVATAIPEWARPAFIQCVVRVTVLRLGGFGDRLLPEASVVAVEALQRPGEPPPTVSTRVEKC